MSETQQPLTKRARILAGVKKWASYHRANPQRFAKEYLKIKLHLFQQILLYMCFHVEFFMYLAARGQGKSWLIALICIIRCMLYPNTVIILASGTKGQARLIITQKVVDFRNRYPAIRRAIVSGKEGIKTGTNECAVYFKNGSRIEAVTSNDNARGYRGNILVLDEFRLIKEEILKKVLRPFLNVNRQPPYLMKPEYKHLQEENKEIYISSAWYKNHWCWNKFKTFAKAMCRTEAESHFACGLNYKLSLLHGILTPKRVEAIKREEDFDEISWLMEMDCVFFGENEKSYFKLDDIHKNRNILKPFYPINNMEFLQNKNKGGRLKNKNIPKKQEGEIRILGVDVAMMGGNGNDNSIFTLMRLIPVGETYDRYVPYIEHLNGQHSTKQAIRLKQLYYDFECDWVAMDTQGNGISLFDDLVKVLYDEQRDVEYPAWTCINNEKMSDRAQDRNAIPIIYSIKAVGNNHINHRIATGLRGSLQKSKLKLLINELDGRDTLSNQIEDFDNLEETEKAKMLRPYIQTTALQNEMINLEYSIDSGWIRIFEVGSNRKDRYSSLAYANYYASILEEQLKKDTSDPEDELVYF